MDASTAQFVADIETEIAIPAIVALVGYGLTLLQKHLKLQAGGVAATVETAANTAIQNAVANFAGSVTEGIKDGSLTHAGATKSLQVYLAKATPDAVATLKPAFATLATMLTGKLAALGVKSALPGIASVPVSLVGDLSDVGGMGLAAQAAPVLAGPLAAYQNVVNQSLASNEQKAPNI